MNLTEQILKKHQSSFHPVVPLDPRVDRVVAFDLSEGNEALTDEMVNDTRKFCDYINEKLENSGARYAIGGYGEMRSLYSRSQLFGDVKAAGEEPRRFHIGTDIWGRPQTPVIAPIDAIVHSFAYNDSKGDYGATIILTHILDGHSFHTLYGHLSLNSIRNLQPGEKIARGDYFGEFGLPNENGHWPPHLHFQIIHDLEGMEGDYPGVCRYSERERFMANCPDPEWILGLRRYVE